MSDSPKPRRPRNVTRAELLAAVRAIFPPDEQDEAIRLLDQCPTELQRAHWKDQPERMQAELLSLSQGQLERLQHNVTAASIADYREWVAGCSQQPWSAVCIRMWVRLARLGLTPWREWLEAETLEGRVHLG